MSEQTANREQPWNIKAGRLINYPGCWIVSGSNASGKSWSCFRKEDGTFWEVVREDLFTLKVELGNEVTDAKFLTSLREYYVEWQQAKFRVEVFDCPERGFRNFSDRESANQYRDSLVSSGVTEANIRIVAIKREGDAF
jgi:hypothetical protein